ncbi:F-box domain containing protein [Parasponia andersonii]|uniref:F-box domain containing protein n=1 Tax=Parasponia andersonii TaxID=3476 RepID=A0A2P5AHS9_PARAD|nr:F-box domain containing protein [Parasponia andersonii]
MTTTTTTTMMGKCVDLPEEVMVEIMSWLPPDSLIRFKVVSKSWYAIIKFLINDSEFVAKHLSNMKNDMSSLALVYQSPCTCEDVNDQLIVFHSRCCPVSVPKIYLDHDDGGETDHNIDHVIEDLPRIPYETDETDRLEYHCNGVIVLTRYESESCRDFILYNPAVTEFRILPQSMLLDSICIKGGGLGFDSRANDYKLVKFGHDWRSHKSKAVVYRLSTGSWVEIKFDWNELKFDLDIDDIVINSTGVFCKGVIYWHVCIHKVVSVDELQSFDEILRDKLLSFNVSDEIFRGLPLPDNLKSLEDPWDPKWNTLAVWNESLAMFHYPKEREAAVSIQVWVMDESSESWIKQLVVGPPIGACTALTFWKTDELLMQGEDKRLVSYNLRSRKLRNLAIVGVGKNGDAFEELAFPYVKSLVSVKERR